MCETEYTVYNTEYVYWIKEKLNSIFFESELPFQLTITSESILLSLISRQTVLTWSLTFSKLPVDRSLCAKAQAENMHNFWCLMSWLYLKLKRSVLKLGVGID